MVVGTRLRTELGAAHYDVPSSIAGQLADAVRRGRDDAAGWARIHPTGSERRFGRDALAALDAPPIDEAARRDLDAVLAAQRTRTAELDRATLHHDARTGWDAWDGALAQIRREQGPEQAKLAADLVQASTWRTHDVVATAKEQFGRQRPFEVDSSISTVIPPPVGNASYPSGHASGAYAAALVLGAFLPDRARELEDAAAQVAYSRVYAGVHFPSDVVAGAYVASRVAADVLRRGNIG